MGNSIVLNFLHSWRPAGSTADGSRSKMSKQCLESNFDTRQKIANYLQRLLQFYMQKENSNLGSNANLSSAQSIRLKNRI
jgi:hypothetical protein